MVARNVNLGFKMDGYYTVTWIPDLYLKDTPYWPDALRSHLIYIYDDNLIILSYEGWKQRKDLFDKDSDAFKDRIIEINLSKLRHMTKNYNPKTGGFFAKKIFYKHIYK